MAVIDEKTTTRQYLLPHQDNNLEDDVGRLRSALSAIDADMAESRPVVGDIRMSLQSPGANWLPCDGLGYAQSSYPALAAKSDLINVYNIDTDSWSLYTTLGNYGKKSIAWSPSVSGGRLFGVYGGSVRGMYSSDGITWTASQSGSDAIDYQDVCWSAYFGKFYAVGVEPSIYAPGANTSLSGQNFDDENFSKTESDALYGVCAADEIPIVVAVGNNQVVTFNSKFSSSRTPAAANFWRSVCWSPELGLFVAVASSGTGNRVMTSPDGITWTARSSAADNDWYGVCWSPELGLFVAVASSGTGNRVMTSPDGITWTTRASAADNSWRDVAWSPEVGLFVAVASSGVGNRIMTSPDGITWTARTSPADYAWNSIIWVPELTAFVASASNYPVVMICTAVAVGQGFFVPDIPGAFIKAEEL